MTQVDFYITAENAADARLKLACTLCDEAMQRDQHVFVNVTSEREARQLDELLWTFIQGSFIPHRVVEQPLAEPPPEPVIVGLAQEPVGQRWDLLINLAADVPEFFSRYSRVAELVDGDAARREQSRERYRFYRDRGYPLSTREV